MYFFVSKTFIKTFSEKYVFCHLCFYSPYFIYFILVGKYLNYGLLLILSALSSV